MERVCPLGYRDIASADAVYESLFTDVFLYLKLNGIKGNIVEFGSYQGYSSRLLAKYMNKFHFIGSLTLFDSWEGMPEINSEYDQKSYAVAVLKDWKKGCYCVPEGTPDLIKKDISELIGGHNISLVKGYYQDTLKSYEFQASSLALINIDCDLFESIDIVLKKIIDDQALFDGSVILFDDWNLNRANPNMGARKAVSRLFDEKSRYQLSFFLNYSWHGRAFIVHDKEYEMINH